MKTLSRRLRLGSVTVTVGEILFGVVMALTLVTVASSNVRFSGLLTSVLFMLVYSTAARQKSIWCFSMERAVKYHKALAFTGTLCGIWHGWLGRNKANATSGAVLLLSVALMALAAQVRRPYFDVFIRAHILLALFVVLVGVAHGAVLILFGFLLWLVDVIARACSTGKKVAVVKKLSGVVCLELPQLDFKPGQYVFLCVPQLSYFEWHPISVSSAPSDPTSTLHVRALGDWTHRLSSLAPCDALPVLVCGGCGGPSIDVASYDVLLCVSGGIGITPLMSITNHLLEQKKQPKYLRFVWAVADRGVLDVAAKAKVLHGDDLETSPVAKSVVAEIYVTRETQQTDDLRCGRPDLPAIFDECSNQRGHGRVGVLVCGPKGMVAECARLANPAYFDLHFEHFEL